MPREKPLIEDADAERKKAPRTIIEVAMKIQGFRNYAEIARRIDLDPSCFGQRLRNCKWSVNEMARLAKTLHLTPHQAGVILGIEKWGRDTAFGLSAPSDNVWKPLR